MTTGGHAEFSDAGFTTEPCRFAMNAKICKNRVGFYGWTGFGGSVMQWDPTLKIGFAYVPVDLQLIDFAWRRGATL